MESISIFPSGGVNLSALDRRFISICFISLICPDRRHSLRLADPDRQPGARSPLCDDPDAARDHLAHVDDFFVEFVLVRLDARQIKYVVDDAQEMLGAVLDVLRIVQISRRPDRAEGLGSHQVREADDRVQRRTQLMAHVGEEFGLHAAGGLRVDHGLDRGTCREFRRMPGGLQCHFSPSTIDDASKLITIASHQARWTPLLAPIGATAQRMHPEVHRRPRATASTMVR
jgi:hypothetical protein